MDPISDTIFDGSEQEMKVCVAQGMNSLLEPNLDLLNYFHGFPKWAEVKKTNSKFQKI